MRTSNEVRNRIVIEKIKEFYDCLCQCEMCKAIRLLHLVHVAKKVDHEK